MISIALIDDHLIFLDALEKFLEKIPNFNTVFKGTSAEALLEQLRAPKPIEIDVLLLDIKMSGMSGLKCLEIISREFPAIKVIIVSMFHESSFIKKAINLGALSFIPKDIESEVLIQAINSVYSNGFYAYGELSNHLVDKIQDSQSKSLVLDPKDRITKSEFEVLVWLCQGYTAEEIGNILFKSKRTVEGYKQRMLDKTNMKNTTSLVAWALRNGVVA